MSTSHVDSNVTPADRHREDMEKSSPECISRHDSLYFENGNIVLFSLPKDNVVTAFKIYKDFLSLYSPVFAGMLSLPPHPDVEKYEDVPLVRLPDEATDLIPFLSAIYHPTDIPSRRDFYVAYDKVESIFKLSKKYQCDALYKCMKDKLLETWPLDLKAWDSFVENKRSRERRKISDRVRAEQALRDGDSDDPNEDLGENTASKDVDKSLGPQAYELNPVSMLPDPCSAIRLARDYDVPQILPAAFYHLFCIIPGAFSDTKPEDGDHWGRSNSPFGSQANFTLLSPRDVMCFVRGSCAIREFLNEFTANFVEIVVHSATRTDPAYEECKAKKCDSTLQSFAKENMENAIVKVDMLEILRRSKALDNLFDVICKDCSMWYARFARDTRSKIWESLPKMFAL